MATRRRNFSADFGRPALPGTTTSTSATATVTFTLRHLGGGALPVDGQPSGQLRGLRIRYVAQVANNAPRVEGGDLLGALQENNNIVIRQAFIWYR